MITSSGTTGTISILPKDKRGATEGMVLWKICLFQTFGQEPTEEELNPNVDVIWPNFASGKLGHLRIAQMIKQGFTGGDESKFHPPLPRIGGERLDYPRVENARGGFSRGVGPASKSTPALAARKDEFIAMQLRQPQELDAFFVKITEKLRGRRVFMTSAYPQMYEIAKAGLERGVRNVFAKDSAILTGGGMKGVALPDNFLDVIMEFLGVDTIQQGYGFSESSTFHWACEEGRYHVMPWVIPFVLDPDTSAPLPRTGRQTGRAAVCIILLRAHWGGVISGDEVTIDGEICSSARAGAAASRSRRTSSATATSRASRMTGSPARPPRRCTQRGDRLHEGCRIMSGLAADTCRCSCAGD